MHKYGLAKEVTSTFEGQTECFIRNSKVNQKQKGLLTKWPFCFINPY